MKIAVYSRDESGIIEFHGVESGWESLDECAHSYLGGYQEDGLNEPIPMEMVGWPDPEVIWYGDVGLAER